MSRRIMIICGTRPEAIKMAPLITAFQKESEVDTSFCITGQHGEMIVPILEFFDIKPEHDLKVLKSGQSLADVTGLILSRLTETFKKNKPERVFVHGDTNTTFAASLASYYAQIPVSHVEAGLRTRNIYSPWPEEGNRRLTGVLADRHYAPTDLARSNLLEEFVPSESILVTGNTIIDALQSVIIKIDQSSDLQGLMAEKFPFLNPNKELILVTGHRRENFGSHMVAICEALKDIVASNDVQVVYSVHMNPSVKIPVNQILGGVDGVHIIPPQDYLSFVYLMRLSHHIISDSGGIQEEASALGKPLLLTRATTERPEALASGVVKLVGADRLKIVEASCTLIEDESVYAHMSKLTNVYGDGTASKKIVDDFLNM